MTGEFKFCYLFQDSYWAQQAIVIELKLEKPRKDYKELVGYHIVTLLLIGFKLSLLFYVYGTSGAYHS